MKAWSASFFGLWILAAAFGAAWGFEDVTAHPSCAICGMDREEFASSRMRIEFEDGRTFGTCSLRCAAWILHAEEGSRPRSVKVADYDTRELVEAEGALWVLGGKKPGVMTAVPKWAFRNEQDADRFVAEFGGVRATYREALDAASKELE